MQKICLPCVHGRNSDQAELFTRLVFLFFLFLTNIKLVSIPIKLCTRKQISASPKMPKELNLYFHYLYLYFYDATTQLQHMICIHYSFLN